MRAATSSSLHVQPPEPVKLAPIDEEKVSNIMEVCQIPREEALRVLDACHMDETMAIERILSGNGISSWSQVSKKKKPPSHTRASTRPSYQSSHSDRDRDRDRGDRTDRGDRGDRTDRGDRGDRRDRRDRDPYSQSNSYRRSGPAPRHHSQYSQRQKDAPAGPASTQASRKRPQSGSTQPDQASPARRDFAQSTQSWASPPIGDGWTDAKPSNGSTNGATDAWADSNTSPQSWGDEKALPPVDAPDTQTWGTDAVIASPTATVNAWGVKDPVVDPKEGSVSEASAQPEEKLPSESPKAPEPPKAAAPVTSAPAPAVKRTFNYAAAAAAGTSHEKPAAVAPERVAVERVASERVSPTVPLPPVEAESPSAESVDLPGSDAAVARAPRAPITRPARPANPEPERPVETPVERRSVPSVAASNGPSVDVVKEAVVGSGGHTPVQAPTKTESRLESPAAAANTWAARAPVAEVAVVKEDKQLGEASTALAVASAAVVGNEPAAGDALSLQFGSFGLGGLDVNWSAPEQKASEPVPPAPVAAPKVVAAPEAPPAASTPVAKPPKTVASPVAAPAPANVAVGNPIGSAGPTTVAGSAPIPVAAAAGGGLDQGSALGNGPDMRMNNLSSSGLHLPTVSSAGNGSGMFPMLAMGPGGNFAPANYGAPYLVPPLHGYSPVLGSYENGSELGSSRGPNLAPPGSLPLYDPSNLPGMGSGNGKYGAIPGLGDMSGLAGVPTGVGKEGLQMNGGDMEKANGLGTSGLGSGMDPLAAPYMMPGYPSMQYPMYTFPTGPYGPPGIAPPGANPFPYAAAGQVSSQGGRGGFGFDDGSVPLSGNSRNGNALGDSMYTPGGYLNNSMSHNVNQKGGGDASYKSVRGNGGGALGGMGMGGGMVAGMGYGDYGGGMSGVGNGVGSNVGGPGGWGNRQGNAMRGDGNGGSSGMVSNGAMGGGAGGGGGGVQGSSGYAGGQGGQGGGGGTGYWAQQQGGYYP